MTTDDAREFDRQPLVRADRPRPLPPDADVRIRRAMLDAFDGSVAPIDLPLADHHLSVVPIVEDDPEPQAMRPSLPRRGLLLVAAAAVIASLVVGTALLQGGRDDVVPTAPADDPDRAAVSAFCNAAFNPAIADVADFLRDGRPEPLARALRGVELAVQAYADLAATTTPELATVITTDAADLQARAAAIRRSGATDGALLEALAADLARAVAELPGSRPCRTDRLEDTE